MVEAKVKDVNRNWDGVSVSLANQSGGADYFIAHYLPKVSQRVGASKMYFVRQVAPGQNAIFVNWARSADTSISSAELMRIETECKRSCVESTRTYVPFIQDDRLPSHPSRELGVKALLPGSDTLSNYFSADPALSLYRDLACMVSAHAISILQGELLWKLLRKNVIPGLIWRSCVSLAKYLESSLPQAMIETFYVGLRASLDAGVLAANSSRLSQKAAELRLNNIDLFKPTGVLTPAETEAIDRWTTQLEAWLTAAVTTNDFRHVTASAATRVVIHSLVNNLGLSVLEEFYLAYLLTELRETECREAS